MPILDETLTLDQTSQLRLETRLISNNYTLKLCNTTMAFENHIFSPLDYIRF